MIIKKTQIWNISLNQESGDLTVYLDQPIYS